MLIEKSPNLPDYDSIDSFSPVDVWIYMNIVGCPANQQIKF